MYKYNLEFVLHIQNISQDKIKDSISNLGEEVNVVDCQEHLAKGRNFKININTEDPTIVFDTCAQFGRIKSVKIHEERRS